MGASEIPGSLGHPPGPHRLVSFTAVTVEAGRNAVAQFGWTSLDLGFYVVNGRGVSSAVGTAVAPGFEYRGSKSFACKFLAKEMRAINLMLHNAEAGRWLSLCR